MGDICECSQESMRKLTTCEERLDIVGNGSRPLKQVWGNETQNPAGEEGP